MKFTFCKNLLVAAEKCNTQRRREKWVRISYDTSLKSNHFLPVRGEGNNLISISFISISIRAVRRMSFAGHPRPQCHSS